VKRGAVIALLFLAVRAAIAWARDPFYDELFTVWMARRPFSGILPALLVDSGPPLYYFIARIPSVMAERVLSIAFACVPLVLLLREKRWTAAALLAIHPAAAILGATARPYALCGALLAVGVLLIEREKIEGAAAAFVAAAYTHFAAAFFLPTLLLARVSWRRRIVTCALAGIAFLPGLLLSLQQPRAATAWMTLPDAAGLLNAIAFFGDDPALPMGLMASAFALTIVAASRSWRFAPFVLVPLALCLGVTGLLRPAYFPIRFASLIAFPLVLWIADSLGRWGSVTRKVLFALLIAMGLGVFYAGLVAHLGRPLSDYRLAAIALRQNAGANDQIVATGYLYLETVHQLGESRVRAFPPEQAEHPGWRVPSRDNASRASLPRGSFLWIGERGSAELELIRRQRETRLVYENPRALIVLVR
jgi:hypothetical protein